MPRLNGSASLCGTHSPVNSAVLSAVRLGFVLALGSRVSYLSDGRLFATRSPCLYARPSVRRGGNSCSSSAEVLTFDPGCLLAFERVPWHGSCVLESKVCEALPPVFQRASPNHESIVIRTGTLLFVQFASPQ